MRAAVLHEVGAPLQIEEVTVGSPRGGEVAVRLCASGVCHSDLHTIDGSFPWPLPAIFGHEGAGVVEAVGPGVANVAPGDHVILTWLPYCGTCRMCRRGRPNLCEGQGWSDNGTMMDGTVRFAGAAGPISHCTTSSFAEHTVVAAQTCIPVDPALDLVELSLFGCAVMTGVGAVLNTARVQPGESVAVVGCGGVGLNVVQGARIAGAGRIVAIDRVAEKLALAVTLGATETIDAAAVDPVEALAPGVDHVFEAIGRPATIELATNLTGPGGQAILIGMAPMGATARFTPLDLTLGERVIRGSWYGGVVPDRDFPRLLDLYRDGALQIDPIVRRIALDDINGAFDAIRAGDAVRSVIVYP
jgi:S-(hydroxymethyl)glutathione dehydrogenase / alcohol dehydrogenase